MGLVGSTSSHVQTTDMYASARDHVYKMDKWFNANSKDYQRQVIDVFNSLDMKHQMITREEMYDNSERLFYAIGDSRRSLVFNCKEKGLLPTPEKLYDMTQSKDSMRELLLVIIKCIFLDYELFVYETYGNKLVEGIDIQIVDGRFVARGNPDSFGTPSNPLPPFGK